MEVILKYRFPVEVATKSRRVLRDLDLLKQINKVAILPYDLRGILRGGTIVSFSISTLDEKLAKIFELGAPLPMERLGTMRECKEEGLFTGVNFMPILPFLSDSEEQIDEMIKAAKDYGADYILVGGLTLFGRRPSDCKTLYYKTLEKYYPKLVPKYKNLFRIFFAPPKEYQATLEEISRKICRKHDIKLGIL